MEILATPFRTILEGLKVTLGLIAHRDTTVRALLVLTWARLGRTIQRFERLVALWQSGKLPRPRTRGPRAKRPATPKPRLPRGQAWLVRRVQDYNVNTRASQLQHFLANTPELQDFLTAAPQANRLLRPLCRMLGLTPPGGKPPPAPRPAKPPPKPRPTRIWPPAAATSGTPPRPLAPFSPIFSTAR